MRISKNKFIKLIPTSEHEFKALEEYLEEKSLEGWMLEDIKYGFFRVIFLEAGERCTHQNL